MVSKVSGPYARALLELARSKYIVEKIAVDIEDLLLIFDIFPEILGFLENPVVSSAAKKIWVRDIVLLPGFSKETVNFLYLLIDRRRIQYFTAIAEKVLKLINNDRGVLIASYTSVLPLDYKQDILLSRILKTAFNVKEVRFIREIDKSILGGFVLKIDSTIIDISLKGKLLEIANQLGAKANFNV